MKRNKFINKRLVFFGIFVFSLLTSVSSFAFDHQFRDWGQVLKRNVKDGLVDYKAILEEPNRFKKTIGALESVTGDEYKTWIESQKKAFWVNAYNIGAIKHVLDNYPIKKSFGLAALRYPANSIQQISGVWDKPVLRLLGQKVSLNYIEHEVLRKEFGDPRIHFAIVCASIGCPVLREEAYMADQLESQLEEQIKAFIDNPSQFRYTAEQDTLYLSPILKWFSKDFDKSGGVIAFLKEHLPQPAASKVSSKTRVKWQDYDWSLNEQK